MLSVLILAATPIGNLQDASTRLKDALANARHIAAEDTRTLKQLAMVLGIKLSAKLYSLHEHNEQDRITQLVEIAKAEDVLVVSDAGMPTISDPGFLLTRACVEHGIPVECLPGATAFVPALVNSGLPNDKFVFEGFLPDKKGRQTRFLALAEETRTMILYVSPHKLVKTLGEFIQYFGPERPVSVSRELSKLHEETVRGTATEVLAHFTAKEPRGEIVVIVGGAVVEKKKREREE